MPRNTEPSFRYLVRATGDRLRKQIASNKRWEQANPERRRLTVRRYIERKREAAKQRQARVDAYLYVLDELEKARISKEY